MNALHAIETIENAMTMLGLRDCYGGPVIGIVATGAIASFHGEKWTRLLDAASADEVTWDEYVTEALRLIDEYARDLYRRKLEQRLAGLILDQRELA